MKTSKEIRNLFIDFFKNKEHTFVLKNTLSQQVFNISNNLNIMATTYRDRLCIPSGIRIHQYADIVLFF